MRIRCLSIHADYACAHSGACCHAGWTIPVEESLVEPLRTVGIHVGLARVAPTRPEGACVFFEADRGRLCRIHRLGGPSLLPSVCRHFPRVVVNDPRGTSVTLSHFCPTAAGLLFRQVPLAVVDAHGPLALDGNLDGLDATDVLPPLLAPNVLADWDGYSAWEEAAVALFNAVHLEPEQAVGALLKATKLAGGWRPGKESLAAAVRAAFVQATPPVRSGSGRWDGFERAVKAFLAAHAFASWAAYKADGLRAVAGAVEGALELLTREINGSRPVTRDKLIAAMRATDLRLRHRAASRDGVP